MRKRTDAEIKSEAQHRANRAKSYADKFPERLAPADLVFQDKVWQEGQVRRFGALDPELQDL